MTARHYVRTIEGGGVLPARPTVGLHALRAGDSALQAFTDFTVEYPFMVDEDRKIDDALQDMIQHGVRALLTMRAGRMTGLITSYDIQGEKPLQFLQGSHNGRHQDICVGHIMTPLQRCPAIDFSVLQRLTAGEVYRNLYEGGLTHLLVVESSEDDSSVVRGIVSRSWLERSFLETPRF
jgi:hypothetical protein